LRIIDEHRLWSHNWDILEHFLAQCAVQFPHSFDYVARVVVWRLRIRQEIDTSLWTEIAQLTAFQTAQLGRDSETVWAIWLLKELGQTIPRQLSDTLLANSGSLVLGFLAHFPKYRLAGDRKLFSGLRNVVEGDPFAGKFWPLTLELTHLAKSDPKWGGDATAESLRTLHEAKISIIHWDALPRVFPEPPDDGNHFDDPDHAIEDYGSDYGGGVEA
jgi:hypothetical protein